jgi:hypothetical protein
MSFANSVKNGCFALVAAIIAIAFLFAIIGVFGLAIAICALIIFIIIALWTFRYPEHLRGTE